MKRNILNIALVSVALAAAALTSCKENELDLKKAGEGRKISFAISETTTRTEYDASENLQINWTEGDKVRIFCDEAEDVKNAEYTVSQISKNAGKLVYNDEGLAWGGDDLIHNFYAVYPADTKMIAGVTDGKVTVNANLNQMCTLEQDIDGSYKKDANGMYNTVPDMSNAVMVANLSTKPVDEVALSFKPIMTTLEVVVRGSDTENTGVEITGISINMKASAYGASSKQFIYDIKSAALERSSLNSSVQFFVGIKGADGTSSIHLDYGESIKLTAFLPPIEINTTESVQVRVHATGATELVATLGGEKNNIQIAQSSKRRITLPLITTKIDDTNNWITPLDGSIYVSQMSIPGTHDAATGDGTTFSIGKTQELTLDKQFELGIRAFDLRPALNSDKEMILCHGIVATTFKWDNVMERFKYYLKDNPGEFIIALIRHEDEYRSGVFSNVNTEANWKPAMQTKLEEMKATINPSTDKSYTEDFRPDLTIDDLRGKILFLCRDWTKYNDDGPVVGGYTGWSHNVNGDEVSIYSREISGILNIQDCYAPSEDGSSKWYNVSQFPTLKWNAIEQLLNKSRNFHVDRSLANRWSINHTSGYVEWTSTTDAYRENAANNNVKLYNYINDPSWNGSTGIVIMDFVGARTSGSYTVYGDLCPQAIINNNYKYHMLRKGEE